MMINNQDNICSRCHIHTKLLETFKKCSRCSTKHCNQCWSELQISDDYKILIDILPKTHNSIAKRICSTYQRNRDVIGDTALLSAFISLQTCATDLEQLKYDLDHQRQHFETLQEKLTALRDAREALNILRYEHHQKQRQEQEHLEQQRRVLMIQKVADLRQFKHTQIANFQENYFQHLLDEEHKMKELFKKPKIL
ncbi:unnamed protein product [Rotaria socialis]|uniref:Hepatocyte growth factor-regulated tyrosine kinase substrate helical domain-containing protein n=1 Tax=Rotaria socialis TaxID=392032 RepID=A0A821CJM5_9BILA|nr:unnamed protein product [Rotaria socialis]